MDGRGILHRLAELAAPILVSNITSMAVPTVVVAFVGNKGSATEIAAIGLANVFCNVTGRSVMWGLAGAMDTLSTQAWGAKNYDTVGATARLATSPGGHARSSSVAMRDVVGLLRCEEIFLCAL